MISNSKNNLLMFCSISVEANRFVRITLCAVTVLIAELAGSSIASAQSCNTPIGSLYSLQGEIKINSKPAVLGQSVCADDRIDVSAESRTGILLTQTQTVVRVDQSTSLSFQSTDNNKTLIEILRGILHLFTRQPAEFGVIAPYANAMVEGTEFVVSATSEITEITVIEGTVRLQNTINGTEKVIEESYVGRSASNGTVETILDNSLSRSVYWAVHYPHVKEFSGFNESLQAVSRLLEKGRHESASALLAKLLTEDPENANALALQSIMATAQRRLSEAITTAEEAVRFDPQSSLAYAALSYAQQGNYNLPSAKMSAVQAVKSDPTSVYALSRLAEVEIIQGDFDAAISRVDLALGLDPEFSRSYTMLGFIRLNKRNITSATSAFIEAIRFDDTDPMPRLGLGLAKIKKNELRDGRRLIEIAVSLDPLNSLLRSYLGKAYYEEEEPVLADEQFSLGKRFDVNDPTPWYYDAISFSPSSTPISELKSLEKAIQLNDNRSIYRSRLALDSDLATRGVSLSHLYQMIGFSKRASVEAVSSLGIDPSNYSAHDFLSGSYASTPRFENARISEHLQSLLLNPLNTKPIDPKLSSAYSNSAFEAGNTLQPGYNEYTSLFERNGPKLTAFLKAGDQDTFNGDLVASWLRDNMSFSAGISELKSDGFRPNNDATTEIHNLFSQWTPNNRYSFQFEYRHRSTEQGDLRQSFDLDAFSENRRREIEFDTFRIGSRIKTRSNSTMLISGFSSLEEARVLENTLLPNMQQIVIDTTDENEATGLELQHIYVGPRNSLTTGIGAVNAESKFSTKQEVNGSPRPIVSTEDSEKQQNAYTYFSRRFDSGIDLTMGMAYSNIDTRDKEDGLWQPKLGFLWQFDSRATLRAAYLKTLKRFLVAGQSIEPTQVAGFNQVYDDTDGTESEHLGLALDLHPNDALSLTFEARQHNTDFKTVNSMPNETQEDVFSTSVSWMISENLALAADLNYEHYENPSQSQSVANAITDLKTIRVPVKFSYFTSKNTYLSLRTLFLRQDLERVNFTNIASGRTDTLLADLGLGFSFAKGRGQFIVNVTNITDTKFRYQDNRFRSVDVTRPTELTPERIISIQAIYRLN